MDARNKSMKTGIATQEQLERYNSHWEIIAPLLFISEGGRQHPSSLDHMVL